MSNTMETKIPLDRLGTPGVLHVAHVVPVFLDGNLSDEERLKDTSIRKFELKALLGKSTAKDSEISMKFSKDDGDSFVLAHPQAVVSKLYSPTGEIFFQHNSNKELSLIEFECEAETVFAAKNIFIDAIAPFIDRLSFVANIPLHILRISCTDVKHQIQTMDYLCPHASVKLNPHESSIFKELFPVYALYREAKNNPSPYYKFLCYYKIIEGIYTWLKPQLFKRAKAKSIAICSRKEVVPDLRETSLEHSSLIGKSIKKVFDTRFRSEFRNQTAHFLLQKGQPLNVSDFRIGSKYSSEIVLIEACANVVINTHQAYLEELKGVK
ncbi:MAG: hypothetical protein HAW67_01885 [Endozoicomonadaceae bacterium]|nr:hypothetical protein [Endozoicomonadaceae bacterium]